MRRVQSLLLMIIVGAAIAHAQDATNIDGTYSVRESWTVTIIDPYVNKTFKRAGVATGTIRVVGGSFDLINRVGVSAGPTVAGISYDGSEYSVYSQPVLYGIGHRLSSRGPEFVAVVKLSFAEVVVPLGTRVDFSLFQEDDCYTATGSTLSALQGSGTAIDANGLEFDVSSVAALTPGGGGGDGELCDASCQAALSAAAQNLQAAAAAAAEGTGKTGRKLKALGHKVTLGLRHAERAHPKRQPKAFGKVTTELQRLRNATAQATGKVSATTLEALQAAIDALLASLPS